MSALSKPPDWYGHTHLFLDHHSQALLFALGELPGGIRVSMASGRLGVGSAGLLPGPVSVLGEVSDDPNEVVARFAREFARACRRWAVNDYTRTNQADEWRAWADRIEELMAQEAPSMTDPLDQCCETCAWFVDKSALAAEAPGDMWECEFTDGQCTRTREPVYRDDSCDEGEWAQSEEAPADGD